MKKQKRQDHMGKKMTGTYEEIDTTGTYEKQKRQEHMKKQI